MALLTINLSPATLPKTGSHYDLAIAAAVLAASGVIPLEALSRTALLGELGLDGRLRPVPGVLPATLAAARAGFTRVVVPLRQAAEASLVDGVDVLGLASLSQLVAELRGEPVPLVDPVELTVTSAAPTTAPACSTWPTWSGRRRPSGRSRSPRRGGTTCSCTDRRGRARRCSPHGCPGCCPTSSRPTRWRCRRCTRWPASTCPAVW